MWQTQVKEFFLPSDNTIINLIKLNNSVHFHQIWALEMKWGNDLMILWQFDFIHNNEKR